MNNECRYSWILSANAGLVSEHDGSFSQMTLFKCSMIPRSIRYSRKIMSVLFESQGIEQLQLFLCLRLLQSQIQIA